MPIPGPLPPFPPLPPGQAMETSQIIILLAAMGLMTVYMIVTLKVMARRDLMQGIIQGIDSFLLDPDAELRREFEKLEQQVVERRSRDCS